MSPLHSVGLITESPGNGYLGGREVTGGEVLFTGEEYCLQEQR